MHELSLIQEVLRLVSQSARENGLRRITKIKLVVGGLSGALPEALRFSFEAVRASGEDLISGAELEVEEVGARGRCPSCSGDFVIEPPGFFCPECGSPGIIITAGHELYVDGYEGD